MQLVIGLTGESNAGKSHIAKILNEVCGYQIIRFSDGLKVMFPYDGEDGKERETYYSPSKTEYDSYKHYLCEQAELINVKDPDLFIDQLCYKLKDVDDRAVIDDLRTPRQLSRLQKTVKLYEAELIVIRVASCHSFKVSYMDCFNLPFNGEIDNSEQLTMRQIIREVSRVIQSVRIA